MRNAIGAALGLVLASSGAQGADLSKSSETELWRRLNSIADDDWCARAPLENELSRRQPDNSSLHFDAMRTQSICLANHGEIEPALALATTIAESGQDEDLLALQIAMKFDRPDTVLTLLRSELVDQSYAITSKTGIAAINRIAPFLEKRGRREELDRLTLDAALAGRADTIGPDLASFIALHALRAAARENPPVAAKLLSHITDPRDYPALLASREYEAIWPMVEQRVGPQFIAVTGDYLERAHIAFQIAPNDTRAVKNLAHALHWSGRHQEAVAFIAHWREQSRNDPPIDEEIAWAIDVVVDSLDALGRRREADALMDEIGMIKPQEKPWVVNFAVNRALRLVRQGRWKEGLAAMKVARQATDISGSAYAKSLIAGARVCALQKLGRADETRPEVSFLLGADKEWVDVTIRALMCLGRDKDAAQLALEVLADPYRRSRLIVELQPPEATLVFTRAILPQPPELLVRNHEVHAAFINVARVIPVRYHSAASGEDTD